MLLLAAPARAQLPTSITGTWSLFQAAVRTEDPLAMARISRFPLASNDFGGPIASATELRQRFRLIFTAAMRQCLLQQTPRALVVDGQPFHEAFCDVDHRPIRFVFERFGSEVRWSAIDNVNE